MWRLVVRSTVLLLSVLAVTVAFPAGAAAGSLSHCRHVRGYYDVRVKGVGCKTAGKILWRARQGGVSSIQGWTCSPHSAWPGGGFPLEMVCRKSSAVARGWVIDGPA